MIRSAGSLDHLLAYHLAIFARYCLYLTWVECHPPAYMILCAKSRFPTLWLMISLAAHALTLAVDEELHLVGTTIVAPHVNIVTRHPVPVGEEVQHRFLCPLTLIHIIGILGETCEVDDAEVTRACRESVGSRFTDIVETCPDILSTHKVVVLHYIPSLLMRTRP